MTLTVDVRKVARVHADHQASDETESSFQHHYHHILSSYHFQINRKYPFSVVVCCLRNSSLRADEGLNSMSVAPGRTAYDPLWYACFPLSSESSR